MMTAVRSRPDAAPQDVVAALGAWAASGDAAALVAITAIEGRSSRSVGALMAVGPEVVGSISGGCFDAAVVAEARAVITSGTARTLRFGAGSPFIDIVLPCGGGVELRIVPCPPTAALIEGAARLAARAAVTLVLRPDGVVCESEGATGWRGEDFCVAVALRLRLVIAGSGGEVVALAKLATAMDYDVTVLSDAQAVLDAVGDVPRQRLETPARFALDLDAATALVILFHDHDWEAPLLEAALASPAFYIGAMGSKATHDRRLATLAARGASAPSLACIVSPVGLFGPAHDPRSIAVSALAQIVERSR